MKRIQLTRIVLHGFPSICVCALILAIVGSVFWIVYDEDAEEHDEDDLQQDHDGDVPITAPIVQAVQHDERKVWPKINDRECAYRCDIVCIGTQTQLTDVFAS